MCETFEVCLVLKDYESNASRKRSLKTGYGKVFLYSKIFWVIKLLRKKREQKTTKKVTNTKANYKGRWVNALALYDEEGRDYLRKATGSWK